ASTSASSRRRPAGPTNGSPATSSLSPGCSPTSITGAPASPAPNTVWVAFAHSPHAWHPAAAARNESSVGSSGINGAAVGPLRLGAMPSLLPRDRQHLGRDLCQLVGPRRWRFGRHDDELREALVDEPLDLLAHGGQPDREQVGHVDAGPARRDARRERLG